MRFSLRFRRITGLIFTAVIIFWAAVLSVAAAGPIDLHDYSVDYPNQASVPEDLQGSTHEMAFGPDGRTLWITGQNYDQLVAIPIDTPDLGQGMRFYPMPHNSGHNGLGFDQSGALWIALEFAGEIVRLDPQKPDYATAQKYNVNLACDTCVSEIASHPHGLGLDSDGRTVWYTGKATGTLGRITSDGNVETFPISKTWDPYGTVGGVPIYIHSGLRAGDMWFTELVGNKVGYIDANQAVHEFAIPTHNSRPISITPGPNGNYMWFTEEAGNRIGRVNQQGDIAEFPVPRSQNNMILAALAFDQDGNLWVQQYVDENNPTPAGTDYLVKIGSQILTAQPSEIGRIPFEFYAVPTAKTVMHRIYAGPDRTLWFTELKANKVGRVKL